MVIGLLFGSFDPIHIGHIGIVHQAQTELACDEVRLVVQPTNVFKADPVASLRDRLAMARLALPSIAVQKLDEVIQPEHAMTATLRKLNLEIMGADPVLLLGQDLASGFKQWPDYEEIIRLCRTAVIKRAGADVSSSQIRALIKRSRPISGLVPPAVEEYIRKHQLYS